jgi:serine/threonine-protein kinase
MIYKQKTQEGAVVQEGFVIHIEVSDGLLVEIPDLENKDYVEARDALIDLGFDRSKIKKAEEPSEDVEEELVTRTDPMSGQFVTQDTEITIYISTGAEKSVMPNLIGKTKDEAEKALADAGLVGAPIEVFSDLPVGEVIGQDVDEGTEIEAGSTVEYSVSKGERNATIPTDLVGKTAAEAKTKLEELGFIVVQVEEPSDIYNQGFVVYVDGAGYKVEKGSTVTIVVSSGKSSNGGNTQTPTM